MERDSGGAPWRRVAALMVGAGLAVGGLSLLGGATSAPDDCACAVCVSGTRVSVVGEGEVSVEPDRAEISVGASFEARTAEDAQERVNRVLADVIGEITDLDIRGTVIQTSGISLSPVYNQPRNGERSLSGYRASNTIRVRVDDVSRVGEVLDAAVESDANQGFGISFMLRDEETPKREAIRRAVAQAKSKAATMGEALGMKVLMIEEVSEQGAQRPQPIYRGMERAALSMDAVSTPVEAGQITVHAGVTLVARVGVE